ncbi:MAG: class I SAM-dependent methyltransferase [Chitinophagaceae bacterium]|nr:MAG: class I SAM-dependent methyltransferase [Chitinophagaceae bacterium]
MTLNLIQRILSAFTFKKETAAKPDLAFIAQQLRKPSGDFAPKIAEKMNNSNETLFDFTLEYVQADNEEKILEIGFGSGLFFKKIFAYGKSPQVHGIDFSKEMLDLAGKNNIELINSGKLTLVHGSSDCLPYADNTFDKVYCNMVIYFWEDPSTHLKEIRRVLKPEGSFFTGYRTRESMLGFPFTKHGFILYEPKEWEDVLKANNFSVIGSNLRNDPPFESDSKQIELVSVCTASEVVKD